MEERENAPESDLYDGNDDHVAAETVALLSIEKEARQAAGIEGPMSASALIGQARFRAALDADRSNGTTAFLDMASRLRRSLRSVCRYPAKAVLPSNVRIIGTVNMDDTTHPLSPKVLDRVHVMMVTNPLLEQDDIAAEIDERHSTVDQARVFVPASLFGQRQPYPRHDSEDQREVGDRLRTMAQDHLSSARIEFGLRALRQAKNYAAQAERIGMPTQEIFNNIVLQKVLPKIHLDPQARARDGEPKMRRLQALYDSLHQMFSKEEIRGKPCYQVLQKMMEQAGDDGLVTYWAQ
jgi:hypothetical protein